MYWFCEQFGFGDAQREARLALAALGDADARAVPLLHKHVIEPKREVLAAAFVAIVMHRDEPQTMLSRGFHSEPLKAVINQYLTTLARDFTHPAYFESRLRVGVAHAWARIGLGTYVTAMRTLQQLLLDEVKPRAHKANILRSLIMKILALDMGLACDAYQRAQTHGIAYFIENQQNTSQSSRLNPAVDAATGVLTCEEISRIAASTPACCVVLAGVDQPAALGAAYHQIASAILEILRPGDALGRYGDTGFLAVLRDASVADADLIAQRLRARFTAPLGHTPNITINVAVVESVPGESVDELRARAEDALRATDRPPADAAPGPEDTPV